MSSIKITSFKRFLNQDKQIQKACNYLSKDRALINVLLYADKQDQNLKGLQKWILKQNCQEIRFVKLTEEKSIMPAIQNTLRQNNRNTFVICSKPLNQSIQSIIKANQSEELTDQLKRLTFLFFLPQIDKIQPQNFHLKNIGLITTQIQHIKEHLNIQIQEASFLRPSSSLSSINSEQQFTFQQQFNKAYDMIQLPKQTIKQEDKILEVVLNDNPGVGHYNIKNPPLTGLTGKFSKS